MRYSISPLLLTIVVLISPQWLRADPPVAKYDDARAAIAKSLSLIQKSAAVYRDNRTCFSCHHQTLPTLTLTEAKEHGYKIDEENYKAQIERTIDHLRRGRANYLKGRGQGGGVDTASFGLWALEAGNWQADESTAAVVEYLLQSNKSLDHWRGTTSRPPTQANNITRTAIIVQAIDVFGAEKQQQRIAERKAKVLRWLRNVKARDTEEKVYRLRGLHYLGESKKNLTLLAADLVLDQQKDGGWAQKPGMKTDAYATGTALVALHQAAGVPVTDPVYQRGLKFLLANQQDDGSWHVVTRSRPIQRYFESGYPHGKDQFISISASSWATTALILATPPEEKKTRDANAR